MNGSKWVVKEEKFQSGGMMKVSYDVESDDTNCGVYFEFEDRASAEEFCVVLNNCGGKIRFI